VSTRLPSLAVVGAACVVLSAMLPGATLNAFAAGPPVAKPSPSHHYRVIGGGTPALPSLSRGAMVRGSNGSEYVVGQRLIGKNYRLVFLVHRRGAKHWTERLAPKTALTIYKYSTYRAQLSTDGKRVVAEVNSCAKNRLYVIDAPTKSFGTSPTIDLALSGDDYKCQIYPRQVNLPFIGAVTLPHHKVTLLVDGTDAGGMEAPTLSTGSAEHGFPAPKPLADPGESVTPSAITRDPATGELNLIANGGADSGAYDWTKPAHGAWSDPTVVVPQPADGEAAFALAIAADRGTVYLWVCHYPQFYSDPDDGDLFADSICGTVERGPGGHWGTFTRYAGMKKGSFDQGGQTLALLTNPKTGSLHVVWANSDAAGRVLGLKHASFAKGKWSTPTTLVRGQTSGPLSLALTAAGHPVVGFFVRA
jgi:hypothetical protein